MLDIGCELIFSLASTIRRLVSRVQRPTSSVPSFSILESVIATSIIAILIGISAMIYSNVLASEKPLAVYQAESTVSSMFHELQANKAFFDKTVEVGGCTILQEVDFFRGNESIYAVNYAIERNNKVWYSEKHLVRAE